MIKREVAYIAHPMAGRSGDIKENFIKNKKLVERIGSYMMGQILMEEKLYKNLKKEELVGYNITPWFFAPQLYVSQFIDESMSKNENDFKETRKAAIEFCLSFVDIVHVVHVYRPDELSRGVMDDIERASGRIPVIFKEKYPWEE